MARKKKTELQVVPPPPPAPSEPSKPEPIVAVALAEPVAAKPPAKITKRRLASYQQKQYLQNLEMNYEAFWPSLRKRCMDGNTQALALMARITGLIKDSGFSIQNNIIQANQNDNGERFSFEKIVRALEARDKSAASNIIEISPD